MKPGNTPLVNVDGIFAKLECTNPIGSIKDRIAKYIIDKSEENGSLKKGMTIVEATSGNTGIAVSYYGAAKGYRVDIVMPENMTKERKDTIKALGGNLILCAEGDFVEAAQIRNKLAELPQFFNPDQFSNPLNVECHYTTTGQELLKQIKEHTDKPIDAFVAGIGTGGTIIGIAKALKEIYPDVHIAAVEPAESAVMSGEEPGLHGIQGIGDGFIPAIATDGGEGLHPDIDSVIVIKTEDALNKAKELGQEHGYCVGISSGANYLAAMELQERFETVVTVFSDGHMNYLSQGLARNSEKPCQYEGCKIHKHKADILCKNRCLGCSQDIHVTEL